MINRILIIGASGSGTSTLGETLAKELDYSFFESDDYFWMPPKFSFSQKRDREDMQRLLKKDLTSHNTWVLSGSLCGWGDIFIPMFELVIYLYVDKDLRVERLNKREYERYGDEIKPGGIKHEEFKEFIRWSSQYDEGGLDMRSKATHSNWIKGLHCPVIKIQGDLTTKQRINIIMNSHLMSE